MHTEKREMDKTAVNEWPGQEEQLEENLRMEEVRKPETT